MKKLSVIVLGTDNKKEDYEYGEIIFSNGKNLINTINSAVGKYISFTKQEDNISTDYFKVLVDKTEEEFDCCFINYNIEYDYINKPKILTNEKELKSKKPYFGEYIWSFIYKKDKLLELLNYIDKDNFNDIVDKLFENTKAIGQVLYTHNPNNKPVLNNFCFVDVKKTEHYKNVIYVAGGCNGVFNGYISWIKNLGRCFGDKYDVTILYDSIYKPTLDIFSEWFNCVKLDYKINYTCERLLVTYSSYCYPKNIFVLDENYMFIHGNMSDYPYAKHFYDDIYTKYIAVSKIAAKKAKGYFPTNNIEYLYNPFSLDDKLLKPHLTLVSAQRYSEVKRPERIEIIANILRELEIPFTWNVFTDKFENTNKEGLIYRRRVINPLPYMKDADYFVLLSDSEALPYCVVEALSLDTKVIVTPLEAFEELGVVDKENGYVVPFDYFKEENKDKLIELVQTIYKNKDKEINYTFDKELYSGYNDIFKN